MCNINKLGNETSNQKCLQQIPFRTLCPSSRCI